MEVTAKTLPVPAPRRTKLPSSENAARESQCPQSPDPTKLRKPMNTVTLLTLPPKPREIGKTREETPSQQQTTSLTTASSRTLWPQQSSQIVHPATRGVLKRGVLDALRCPTCSQFMVPPIFMCASGHSICAACKATCRDMCPSCGERIESMRNLALEHLARSSSLFPCAHQALGCRQQLSSTLLRRHEAGCSFRPLACALACGWHQLLPHVKREHPDRHTATLDTSVLHIQWDLPLKMSFHDNRHAVFAFGECFAYVKRFSQEKRRMYLAVHLLGDPANTQIYRYQFEMAKTDGGCYESVTFTRSVLSCDVDIDTVLQQSNICISVDFDTLVYFGKGPRTFEIFKLRQVCSDKSQLIVM